MGGVSSELDISTISQPIHSLSCFQRLTSGSHIPNISVLSTSSSLDCPEPLLATTLPFNLTAAPASNLFLLSFPPIHSMPLTYPATRLSPLKTACRPSLVDPSVISANTTFLCPLTDLSHPFMLTCPVSVFVPVSNCD